MVAARSRPSRRSAAGRALIAGGAFAVVFLAACASPSVAPASPAASSPTPTPSVSSPLVTPTAVPSPSEGDPLARMSLEQKVGQLFMVGVPLDGSDDLVGAEIRDRHVGSVFLHGRSTAGVEPVADLVADLTALVDTQSTAGIPLWIATDQEGGEVQVLRGPGFDDIPYAIRQADRDTARLSRSARSWGDELRAAGVTMNLAPVADIVTSHATRFDNAPIGALGRQYGYDERTVAAKAGAFAEGMRAAGVLPTFKHFPGLGRVTQNTDTTADVHDTEIGADSPDVDVYRELLASGPAVVMVSNAIYDRIDATRPAVFSPVVVRQVLRGDVGFAGVVMSDDLSDAVAVTGIAPADRALRALDAGVDLLLVADDARVLPPMYDAVLARAQSDPDFAALVDEAARRVVEAKAVR